jgi:hypothetical protein
MIDEINELGRQLNANNDETDIWKDVDELDEGIWKYVDKDEPSSDINIDPIRLDADENNCLDDVNKLIIDMGNRYQYYLICIDDVFNKIYNISTLLLIYSMIEDEISILIKTFIYNQKELYNKYMRKILDNSGQSGILRNILSLKEATNLIDGLMKGVLTHSGKLKSALKAIQVGNTGLKLYSYYNFIHSYMSTGLFHYVKTNSVTSLWGRGFQLLDTVIRKRVSSITTVKNHETTQRTMKNQKVEDTRILFDQIIKDQAMLFTNNLRNTLHNIGNYDSFNLFKMFDVDYITDI